MLILIRGLIVLFEFDIYTIMTKREIGMISAFEMQGL